MDEDIRESIEAIEKELGLPKNFLQELWREDDWSFIIKLHALMEAAVSYLLVHHFGDERLSQVFDFMELSDKRKGKMAFVSELELLPIECRRFISKLSEIRNDLVHNITQVTFDLKAYVKALNKAQLENFVKAFIASDLNKIDFGKDNEHHQEIIAEGAKGVIFQLSLSTLELIYLKRWTAETRRSIAKIAIEKMRVIEEQ